MIMAIEVKLMNRDVQITQNLILVPKANLWFLQFHPSPYTKCSGISSNQYGMTMHVCNL